MLKTDLQSKTIFLALFVAIWRSFIFLGISIFSFFTLSILSSFSIQVAIFAIIFFLPLFLFILLTLYYVATVIDKKIDKISDKILKIISHKIMPPIVFLLIAQFSSVIEEGDRSYYYLSIPLSFIIIHFFDKIIKFLERKRSMSNHLTMTPKL
jgi:hypothetical protein